MQAAVKGELWRLRDPTGKPPGVMGWWPSRAVTFIENHDTGSTQGHWPFPSSHVMEVWRFSLCFWLCAQFQPNASTKFLILVQFRFWLQPYGFICYPTIWPHCILQGYAYILTHPGVPTVFYDHFYDWGDSYHVQIAKLVRYSQLAIIPSPPPFLLPSPQGSVYRIWNHSNKQIWKCR